MPAPGAGSALWATAELGALAALLATDHLAVTLSAGAGVPFSRPTFVLEKVGAVFRSSPVVGRFGLGVEARF